ncbi:hypothetical protein D3C80_1552210 [compost metagenome]
MMRSWGSTSSSGRPIAGRNRLTMASRVASLSAWLKVGWRVVSMTSRCDSMAMGELALIFSPQRTWENRKACSTRL